MNNTAYDDALLSEVRILLKELRSECEVLSDASKSIQRYLTTSGNEHNLDYAIEALRESKSDLDALFKDTLRAVEVLLA
jgi:hypothetical protein